MGLYVGDQVIDYLQKHGLLSSSILGGPYSLSKSYNFGITLRISTPKHINRQQQIKHIYKFTCTDRLFSDYISCLLLLQEICQPLSH
jgi:hypothetical protein